MSDLLATALVSVLMLAGLMVFANTTRQREQVAPVRVDTRSSGEIPPIDRNAPANTKTATFSLG